MMAEDLPEVKNNLSNVLELSHKNVMELLDQELNDVIKDPLLRDLPSYPTVEEIKSRIALEKGKAIIINLKLQGEIDTIIRKYKLKKKFGVIEMLLFIFSIIYSM